MKNNCSTNQFLATAKEHYDNHLGAIYSWMVGDFQKKSSEFVQFLQTNDVRPKYNRIAIDLGAGNGIQTAAMAEMGFQVNAFEFNKQLLKELKENSANKQIEIFEENLENFHTFLPEAELIVCCGDTISHMFSMDDVTKLIMNIHKVLCKNGRIILSFRDYFQELKGNDRFIEVKSDKDRILTCFLEYDHHFVNVTDILYERVNDVWEQKISTYPKVRIFAFDIVALLEEIGFTIEYNQILNGLSTIIAVK